MLLPPHPHPPRRVPPGPSEDSRIRPEVDLFTFLLRVGKAQGPPVSCSGAGGMLRGADLESGGAHVACGTRPALSTHSHASLRPARRSLWRTPHPSTAPGPGPTRTPATPPRGTALPALSVTLMRTPRLPERSDLLRSDRWAVAEAGHSVLCSDGSTVASPNPPGHPPTGSPLFLQEQGHHGPGTLRPPPSPAQCAWQGRAGGSSQAVSEGPRAEGSRTSLSERGGGGGGGPAGGWWAGAAGGRAQLLW